MLGFLGTLLTWVLGLFFKKNDPKIEEVAASNATAQTELIQEEASNAIISKGAAVASATNAAIMRVESETADKSDAGINAALKRQFPTDFRD